LKINLQIGKVTRLVWELSINGFIAIKENQKDANSAIQQLPNVMTGQIYQENIIEIYRTGLDYVGSVILNMTAYSDLKNGRHQSENSGGM
jgi:hypothetical protein